MSKEIIIRGRNNTVDVALLEDGKLMEVVSSKGENSFSVGDIYLAKVKKIMPSLNAVFVNVGYEHPAFLHYNDLGPQFESFHTYLKNIAAGRTNPSFSTIKLEPEITKNGVVTDLLQLDELILVQVAKEPISTKGPKLTTEISLAGRNVIILPFSNKISISQKIESSEEKSRLRRITKNLLPVNYGAIIRTAAEGCDAISLEKEITELVSTWEEVLVKLKGARHKTPNLLHRDVDRVSSLLRDVYNQSYTNIVVDDAGVYQEVRDYINSISPEDVKIVKRYTAGPPIFEQYAIERQIKSSFGKTVPVKSGAYLIIEKTEALHVIDVNSGNRTRPDKDQEGNAMEVNMASAVEIARQIRLRDLGGIIIIDFIDMRTSENRNLLFETMKEAMAEDRAKHNILPLSKFGLMQITRQRVRPEQRINTNEVCPSCKGTGKITPSVNLIQEMENELSSIHKDPKKALTITVHPYIAAYIKKGLFSIEFRWKRKYGSKTKVVASYENAFMEYKFEGIEFDESIC